MKTKVETIINLQLTLEDASQLATGLNKTIRNRSSEEREAIDKLHSELEQTIKSVTPPSTQ
jgi:hypothetical protein